MSNDEYNRDYYSQQRHGSRITNPDGPFPGYYRNDGNTSSYESSSTGNTSSDEGIGCIFILLILGAILYFFWQVPVQDEPMPYQNQEQLASEVSNQIEIGAHIDLKGYEFIYLQAKPSLKAKEVGRIYNRQTRFRAVGKSHDSNWIFVNLMDGTEGWIKREFVVADQSLDLLPLHEK